jgi:hypothetical protein
MTWRDRSRVIDFVLFIAFMIFAALDGYRGDKVSALLWLILAKLCVIWEGER